MNLKYVRSKYAAEVVYGSLFNVSFSLIFCMSSFLNLLKVMRFMTRFSKTLLNLLLFYSFLNQLWISLQVFYSTYFFPMQLMFFWCFQGAEKKCIGNKWVKWHRGVVVISTLQLHSTKPELKFYAVWNRARGVSEIRDDEDLWQWSRLEIRLNTFRR